MLPPFPRGWEIPPELRNKALFPAGLLKEPDLPGLIYQALRLEGNKIRQGAYFTPLRIIRRLLSPYRNPSEETVFMDPCCGSGMFLCSYAEMTGKPEKAAGMDLDPLAVLLSRINLFLRFPGIKRLDHIRISDALRSPGWDLGPSPVIATNPPWGAHFKGGEKRKLTGRYPSIRSGESFSLFIARSIEELPPGGKASFLLPESFLYVKTHRDIRKLILDLAPPVMIRSCGPLFQGVYTPVLQLVIQKGGRNRKVSIRIDGPDDRPLLREKQGLSRYRKNRDCLFNIHCSNRDTGILERIYRGPTGYPGKDCRWILGTVTGDNGRFLTDERSRNCLPVLSGREIKPFICDPPRLYIRTDAGEWQQSRSAGEYSPAKIIYTFIGEKPSFAIDRSGVMTLNSANCLIPGRDHCLEEMAAWYNSKLFRFLWRKQYRSLKLLRGHLESLPLPRWDEIRKQKLLNLVKTAENRHDIRSEIDNMIYDFYEIPIKDREYIANEI